MKSIFLIFESSFFRYSKPFFTTYKLNALAYPSTIRNLKPTALLEIIFKLLIIFLNMWVSKFAPEYLLSTASRPFLTADINLFFELIHNKSLILKVTFSFLIFRRGMVSVSKVTKPTIF